MDFCSFGEREEAEGEEGGRRGNEELGLGGLSERGPGLGGVECCWWLNGLL